MSFEIARSGINAINNQLNTISNNIANTGTYGFKASRANFASMYAGSQPSGTEVSSLTQTIGVNGGILTTGRDLDVKINGGGFFITRDSTGAEVFTRVGVFSKDKDGFIIDSFNRKVQGYQAIDGSTALGALGNLQVATGQAAAVASTSLQFVGNMSADWTTPTVTPFDPADPLSFNSSMLSVVYDSLGVQHTLTQYFVKTDTNEVTVHYVFDGEDPPVGTQVLSFDTDGTLLSPTSPVTLALGTPDGAEPLEIDINYAGTTQYAGATTTTTNQANGNASGGLSGVQIDDDGSVMALYSNGTKKKVGTIALATFPNEDALVAVSDTSWTASNASGQPLYSIPGVGMAGSLSAGALEQSNVDITSELVNLMSAQRNYQANTKVISTENEMMQTLMQAI